MQKTIEEKEGQNQEADAKEGDRTEICSNQQREDVRIKKHVVSKAEEKEHAIYEIVREKIDRNKKTQTTKDYPRYGDAGNGQTDYTVSIT